MGRKRSKKQKPLGYFGGTIEELLHLLTSSILVAIDTENMGSRQARLQATDFQIGISILDVREALPKINTSNFVAGSDDYCTAVMPRCLFGPSTRIQKHQIEEVLGSVIPKDEDFTLVGHSLGGDFSILTSFGVPLPFNSAIDTNLLAKQYLPDLSRSRLSRLGTMFDVSMRVLHCAGNDAHYTLVVLLGLAHSKAVMDGFTQSTSFETIAAAFEGTQACILKVEDPQYLPPKAYKPNVRKLLARREARAKIRNDFNLGQRDRKHESRVASRADFMNFDYFVAFGEFSTSSVLF